MNRLAATKQLFDKDYIAVMLTVALPVMLQNLISLGLNLIDVLMIGKVGVDELAAVGAANRIFSLFGMVSFGIISGTSVYVAQFWGVRDIPNIRRVFGLTLSIEAVVAVCFLAGSMLFAEPILHLFIKDDNLLRQARIIELGQDYLSIARWTFLFSGFSFTMGFCSRAIRRLKASTTINASALLTNTVLNYCLIFGNFGFPEMGVKGAALATLIARILELIMLTVYIYASHEHPLAGKFKEIFSFGKNLSRKVIRTSTPVMVTETFFGLAGSLTFVAYSFLGADATAVMQVAIVLNDFFQAIFYGLGNASAVITGNELGRGETELAYKHGKLVIGLTVVIGAVMSILMLLARGPILNIYDFKPEPSAMLNGALLMYSLFMIPRMLDYVQVCGILRAGGDTRFCLLANSIGLWVVGVPFAFLGALVWQWPLPNVLMMVLMGDLVSACICFFRFRSKVWLKTLI